MRGVGLLVRGVLGIAIVAAGVTGVVVPAQADGAVIPGVPTQVLTSNATESSIDVSWVAPASDGGAAISDYMIEYGKVGDLSWTPFVRDPSTATTATVTGLSGASTYAFRVAAVSTAGVSGWSRQESTVDAGDNHSCAVMANGTVQCWGYNSDGQLGDNTRVDKPVPTLVSGIDGLLASSTAVSVSAGFRHSCALMANGSVQCWGWNLYGQLGNNSESDSSVPVSVSGIDGATLASTAVSVTLGDAQSCALMADGSVQCWGYNGQGQLGDGSSTNRSAVPVAVSGIDGLTASSTGVSLSAGANHTCALIADGTVKCWGDNYAGQLGDNSTNDGVAPVYVDGIDGLSTGTTAVGVSAGSGHSCAAMADGTVQCWGNNYDGQLGNDSQTGSLVPVLVSGITGSSAGDAAISVSAGGGHSCSLMADATVQCWGTIRDAMGFTVITESLVPVLVPGFSGVAADVTAVNVTAGGAHTCAEMADGTIKCWGNNWFGRLGNDSGTDSPSPVVVSGISGQSAATRVALSATGRTLAAPTAPGVPTLVGTSMATSSTLDVGWLPPAVDGGSPITDYKVEVRRVGELAWNEVTHAASPDPTLRATGLSPGKTYVFRVAAVNAVGTGAWSEPESPLAAGSAISCAAMANRAARCWGRNDYGQLGNNTFDNKAIPTPVFGITGQSASAFSVAAGGYHACALDSDGTVKCWGRNDQSELANIPGGESTVPVSVSGITGGSPSTTAVSVSAGDYHSCSLMADGSVRCWGYDLEGELGDGDNTNKAEAVLVSGINGASTASTALNVSVGDTHSCAVMATGSVLCWGYNAQGQLGDGSWIDSNIPVVVHGIDASSSASTAVSVSAGGFHSCALMADGSVKCWGTNNHGTLGDGTNSDRSEPVVVSGITGVDAIGASASTTAVSVAAGGFQTCVLLADGSVKCWGSNINGQLGDGTNTDSSLPVSVLNITGSAADSIVVSLSSGNSQSCAVMADGSAVCWGSNANGELGDGTSTDSNTPIEVSGITGESSTTRVRVSAVGTTSIVVPSAPTNVVASGATGTSLDVSWSAPASDGGALITDYVVQAKLASAISWSLYARTNSTSTSFKVTGLAGLSSYVFKVAAVNSVGTGTYSEVSSAVSTVVGAPDAPMDLAASGATTSSLDVSWFAPSSDGGASITNYVVQYRLESAISWTTFMHAVSPSTSITVTGLAASSSYVFRVAAVNTAGTSIYTDPSSPVSTLEVPVLNAPGAPGKPVIGARTTKSVAISWTASAANGSAIIKYVVEYRKGTGAWTTFTRADSTALSVTVTGLTKGGSYTFRVSGVSAGGTSAASTVSAAALAASAPSAPGSVKGVATKVAGQVKVTWKAGSLNGAPSATYKVSWLVGSKWTTPITATGFAYTITKLKPGTYSVKVTATTSQGSASTTKAGIVLKK